MPLKSKSNRQAIRIPENRPHECLSSTSRKGRPNEYPKAARTSASQAQVGRVGQTNTRKPLAQVPLRFKSKRRAKRIRKSCPHKCLSSTSRKGRPNEYEKAARTSASQVQVEQAGHTNTKKPPAPKPQKPKSEGQATRIPESCPHECL